ncbi:MAG: family 25 glycosyl hydrolase [Streptococcaceae bacterium]|nr:family 25 glycosyl hydrolase [Streptococcaceae bacterium]
MNVKKYPIAIIILFFCLCILPTITFANANTPANLDATDTTLPRKDAIDIASYQSWMTLADFQRVKQQGVKTVIIKLTDGLDYVNPSAKQQINFARQAGLNVAFYHYTRLVNATTQAHANDQAKKEAQFFANTARSFGIDNRSAMINDAEDGRVGANVNWTDASIIFANELKNQGFGNVKHYTSLNWTSAHNKMNPARLGVKNMWIAQYLFGKPSATNLKNTQFGAWQYTSQMYFRNMSRLAPIDTSIEYVAGFFFPSVTKYPIYRLYSPNNSEHLYTKNSHERDNLVNVGWGNYEGIAYYAPNDGDLPIYRLYNPKSGVHLYTANSHERDLLQTRGWIYEIIAFTATTYGSIPVYRLYNPKNDRHLYTVNTYERDHLQRVDWNYEGIAWRGVP